MSGIEGMRGRQAEAAEGEAMVYLCSLTTGNAQFGIDTRKIREVLGRRVLERVPLAASYIGGVLPYRGDVLTAVSLRAVLGREPMSGGSCVLVLESEDGEERFGLMVDAVGGVVALERRSLAANPTTLDDVSKEIYLGAYRTDDGLLIELDPARLNPAHLSESGLFGATPRGRGPALGRMAQGQVQGDAR